jgi:hypothetical protein
MRWGAFAFTPTLTGSFGTDTNVFNQERDPKRDLTATLKPRLDGQIRLGRAQLTGEAEFAVRHFQQYADQRSFDTTNLVRVGLPFRRFTLYAANAFTRSRQPLGYEIDTRSLHFQNAVTFGGDLLVAGKTTVGVAAHQTHTGFDSGAVFQGAGLRNPLSRVEEGMTMSTRYALTPLTSVVVTVDAQRDRFKFDPLRNSHSLRVMPGLTFKPLALVTGSASVGYRKFVPLQSTVPTYRGMVAAVDLGYTLLGVTRLFVRADRDVAYSYDPTAPYFLQTGATVSVTQHVAQDWDVSAGIGRQGLDYRSLNQSPTGAATSPERSSSRRVDTVATYRVEVARKIGQRTQVSVHVESRRRQSDSPMQHAYRGIQAGTSFNYGF